MRSAQKNIEIINKMNELLEDIAEEEYMSDSLDSSVNQEVEFDEDELLAELERLEQSPDKSLFEEDRKEDKVRSSPVLSAASPADPAKTGEGEAEDDVEYLRRWVTESL